MSEEYGAAARLGDGEKAYGLVSRINHWIVAGVFITALGLGLTMAYGGLPREAGFALMPYHKFFGVLVLVFGIWRVCWRLVQGFPSSVPGMPKWQDLASKVAHWALLAAIVLMPASGLTTSLAGGHSLAFFGVQLVPELGKVEWLSAAAGWLHGALGLTITAILLVHVGAALKHHFFDHDATLLRMTRGRAA
ncbi:cytochrome b [Amaricoccus macauensis]|uniref:cytochrome b n=1 Tax=Amaricoccus macauensis TaxID=57001 RepID=UPI003C7E79BC